MSEHRRQALRRMTWALSTRRTSVRTGCGNTSRSNRDQGKEGKVRYLDTSGPSMARRSTHPWERRHLLSTDWGLGDIHLTTCPSPSAKPRLIRNHGAAWQAGWNSKLDVRRPACVTGRGGTTNNESTVHSARHYRRFSIASGHDSRAVVELSDARNSSPL